jgi:hypothetical protein
LALIKLEISVENFEKFSGKYLKQIKEYNTFSKSNTSDNFSFINGNFDTSTKELTILDEHGIRGRDLGTINILPFALTQEDIKNYHKNLYLIENNNFMKLFEKLAPQHFNFVMGLFSNFKKQTQLELTEIIINLCFLIFLKNSDTFKDFCPKKII